MVARQAKVSDSRTRVYKYGAVPIGPFPSEGMDELWRANKLWNQLVEIHNNNRTKYEEARCAVNIVTSVQLWRKTNGRSYRELHNLRTELCADVDGIVGRSRTLSVGQ